MNLWSTPLSVPNLRKRQRLLGAPYRAQPHNHERNQIIHFFSTFPNYQIPKLSKNLNFQQPNFDKKPEISSPPLHKSNISTENSTIKMVQSQRNPAGKMSRKTENEFPKFPFQFLTKQSIKMEDVNSSKPTTSYAKEPIMQMSSREKYIDIINRH